MKHLKFAIILALFINSTVYATSTKLPENAERLTCNQMKIITDPNDRNYVRRWAIFQYQKYAIHYKVNSADILSYNIIENNASLKKIMIKNIGTKDYTNANICEDSKRNHYFVLEQGNFEAEDDDGRILTGKIIEIMGDSQNDKQKYFTATFYDQYFKVSEKQTSQFHVFSGYSPEKLLSQDKHLPITYTMFEKDDGLYIKVSSTYKSDVITLKKPTSVK